MNYIGAFVLVLGFIVVAQLFGVVQRSGEVLVRTRQAMADVLDPELDDDEKERRLQRHALRLIVLFVILVVSGATVLLLPTGLVYLADLAGWLPFDDSIAMALSWEFIACVSVAIIGYVWFVSAQSRRQEGLSTFENRYSATDQLLHQVVFGTIGAQVVFADLEDRVFRRRLTSIDAMRPLFITGLPRSGTTMLLNVLS